MLEDELGALEDYNCARHRLRPQVTTDWIQAGRTDLETYSTVTLLARFLGLSTSVPRAQAV